MSNHTTSQIDAANAVTANWPNSRGAELRINGNGEYSLQVQHAKNFADIPLHTKYFGSALLKVQILKQQEQAALDAIDNF